VEEINDDLALSRASQGDNEAFSVLYERYVKRIYNYIYYRTGNLHDAEDLTERVFHRALGHIATYKNMGVPFSAWLYRIAHNLVANWYRDTSRRKEVALEDHPKLHTTGDMPEQVFLQNQENEMLFRTIRMLSPDRQQLLILKFVDHLSNAEIAVIMRRSEGAIKSLYHRTLSALRHDMEKKNHDQE
jgi:RNA polymerase sigma-70 factor (ECF subfamily)